MSFIGKLFSTGRSAAKRMAREAEAQTRLQREALARSQKEFEQAHAQRAAQHAALLAQNEKQHQAALEASRLAQEQANAQSQLEMEYLRQQQEALVNEQEKARMQLEATQHQQQAQLALQQQDQDVVEILPQGTTEEFDTGRKNRKRPPISLGGVGGVFGL